MIVIPGETLPAHSARPRKIPEWIVLVRENISVNKRVYRKEAIEIVLRGFCLLSFSNVTFGFHGFRLKTLKIINMILDLERARKFRFILALRIETISAQVILAVMSQLPVDLIVQLAEHCTNIAEVWV